MNGGDVAALLAVERIATPVLWLHLLLPLLVHFNSFAPGALYGATAQPLSVDHPPQPSAPQPPPPTTSLTADLDHHYQQPPIIDVADNDSDSYFRTLRDRTRDNWIQVLKENILRQIGRANMSFSLSDTEANDIATNHNITAVPLLNSSAHLFDDHITEKIRSFYPSCDPPDHVEPDVWQDLNIMNLYFEFDGSWENIATATVRVYRVSPPVTDTPTPTAPSTTVTPQDDCDPPTGTTSLDEERLIRVSIYWYTKGVRKTRVKRRLSDSHVVSEHVRWVELSVKPATKAWSRGHNLGLALVVEDQEGNTLKADQFFKGVSCTVGASTPRPIPSIIVDAAARNSYDFGHIHQLLGADATATAVDSVPMRDYNGIPTTVNILPPTLDICTLEFPTTSRNNGTHPLNAAHHTSPRHHDHSALSIAALQTNACNLLRQHLADEQLAHKERLERLAMLPDLLKSVQYGGGNRHIRHQRQHHYHHHHHHHQQQQQQGAAASDPRHQIVDRRIVLTHQQVQNIQNEMAMNGSDGS